MAVSCVLKTMQPSVYLSLNVPNLQTITFGRSAITKIKDKRCSKRQVELFANYEEYTITAKQLGPNDCGFENSPVGIGKKVVLNHGDIFEMLFGQYQYKIIFSLAPINTKQFISKSNLIEMAVDLKSNSSLTKQSSCNDESSGVKKIKQEFCDDKWESIDNGDLWVLNKTCLPSSKKIASYDMDGTWITTSSGRVFPKDNNDWKIIFPEVPGHLKKLEKENFKIVLFTNQAGIALGKNTIEGIQGKISRIIKKIGIKAQVFISTRKGRYRKPVTGMWDFFVENCNDGIEVDKSKSFYVGDAAGRPEISKVRKKDHSCADRLFALNIGLPFYTPEEHFKNHKTEMYKMPNFIPRDIDDSIHLFKTTSTKIPSESLEIIVMVGFPGSGKSFFAEHYLSKLGYVVINRDTLGTWQKCVSGVEKAIIDKKKVVVENTHPDSESRKRYIEVAKRLNVPVRCFIYDISIEHAKHNNKFRELCKSDHSKVNDMVYNMYKSKYEEPSLAEGFSEIAKLNFKPLFKNKEDENLYKMFLLEK